MQAGQQITYWKARKKLSRAGGSIKDMTGYALHLHRQYGDQSKEKPYNEIKAKSLMELPLIIPGSLIVLGPLADMFLLAPVPTGPFIVPSPFIIS